MIKSLATPSALFLMRLIGAGAALSVNLLLVEHMDTSTLGIVVSMISLATLASMVPFLSLDSAVIRFIRLYNAQANFDMLRAYFRFLLKVNIWMIVLLAVLFLGLAIQLHDPQNPLAFWQWSPLFPASILLGWMRFRSQIAIAENQILQGSIGRSFVRPIIFLIGITLLIFIAPSVTPLWVCIVFLVSMLIASIVQHMLIARLPLIAGPKCAFQPQWVSGGFALGLSVVFQEYLVELLIIIAALTLESHEVAVLAIALKLSAFARYSVTAVDQSFRAKISKSFAANKIESVKRQLRSSAKMRSLFVLASTTGLAISVMFLNFQFGGVFGEIAIILPITLIDVWVFALLGSPQFILGQTHNATALIPITLSSFILIFLGIIVGSAMGGLMGAAWCIAFVLSLRLLCLFILTYHKTLLNCSLLPLATVRAN